LADVIENKGYERPTLVESRGGAFEIRIGEVLLFSKLKEGRYPENAEVIELIKNSMA
jgi:selT/selW/selH-like putative selenoprotein